MHLFDPNGSGGTQALGALAGTRVRGFGNLVNYDAGKVMILGGSDRTQNPPTTTDVFLADLNGPRCRS
ncbi:MAG: hypothetical protein R3E68_04285 [Burkholderiaceae bacterium]